MKKLIKYFVLFVLLFIPGIAFAQELEIVSVDVCSSDSGVLKVFQVIGYVIYIIKILVPIIIILLGMIEFGKATITKDEKAILSLKDILNCDFKVFTKEDILPIESQFEISQFVKKTIGVGNVCEPSVRLLGGEIILKKQKLDGVTLCIGEIK